MNDRRNGTPSFRLSVLPPSAFLLYSLLPELSVKDVDGVNGGAAAITIVGDDITNRTDEIILDFTVTPLDFLGKSSTIVNCPHDPNAVNRFVDIPPSF